MFDLLNMVTFDSYGYAMLNYQSVTWKYHGHNEQHLTWLSSQQTSGYIVYITNDKPGWRLHTSFMFHVISENDAHYMTIFGMGCNHQS